MKRRIIKLVQATYVTSLPSKWIRQFKLDKGDYIEMDEKDGALIISTQKIAPQSAITIDLQDFNERTIRNVLNQIYRKGYDKLYLTFKKHEQLDIIRDITRETLLGFEVVKEEKNTCTLENIAEPSVEKYDVILRKLFLMIKTEAEEIVEEIEGKQERNNKKREINKNMIDNYTNFIRRLIIKYKIKGGKDSYLLYYLVSQLSLTHHGYYYLCANLYKQKITLSKETIGLLKDTITLYSTFYNAFFKN